MVLNFFMRFQRSKESTLTQNSSSTADIAISDDALKDEQIHSNMAYDKPLLRDSTVF